MLLHWCELNGSDQSAHPLGAFPSKARSCSAAPPVIGCSVSGQNTCPVTCELNNWGVGWGRRDAGRDAGGDAGDTRPAVWSEADVAGLSRVPPI